MTRPRPAARPRLKPLVLALLGALPAAGWSQVRMAPPPAFRVPVPASLPGWRVSGTGAPAPVNTPNARGGTDQVVNQASQSAIYNWQSFDIGAASSVTFNLPGSAASALNRVTGSTSPSAIFGRLTAQYANPTAGGAPLVGGSLYLVNANGILFGSGAQVNVGALVASTLDLADSDYLSGLTQSITATAASFSSANTAPLVPKSFVQVDAGATITTPSGGRVFLFAKDGVSNAGTLTTPNGQTALAAGNEVYLNLPTNEVMYASEVNRAIPAVNGLLVEVGGGNGSVANLAGGVINTPTGNATLVGMAVNQSGRISATTSVSQNGSVLLLARGGSTASRSDTGGVIVKEASVGGALTLGRGSRIDITPDTAPGADGLPATSNASSTFTPSLIALAGKTVELQSGAAIVAPGGVVDVRAESTPYYVKSDNAAPLYDYAALTGDAARLAIDAAALVDVSGTTSTTVSAGRNFVTTALLGASDLADAPLQRAGPVYRAKLTFDVRSPVPILGDTSAYRNAIAKTAEEQLATGGTIRLASTGAVVTEASSTLAAAGGVVTYTDAVVTPSELLGTNGSVYTFNQAPADIAYAAIVGAPTHQLDRWGVVPAYAPTQVTSGVVAPGYTAGQAGGRLSVVSPTTVLDGHLQAGVTQGVRQTAGLDALATGSRLVLGARVNGASAWGSETFTSSGLGDLTIAAAVPPANGAYWADPIGGAIDPSSRIAATTLNASGVASITVTAMGNVALTRGADLALPTGGGLDIAASGAAGIELGANVRAAGGSVSAQTRPSHSLGATGTITLDAGTALDVSAQWVNRALDGATAQASTAGGSVRLASGSALDVQDASRIDVSGAATVAPNGNVAGTRAGSITLQSDRTNDSGVPSSIHLGARLSGNSLVGGGTLTLGADSLTIGARSLPGGVTDGPTIGSLQLSNAFFTQGAFGSYNLGALDSLVVAPSTLLTPQAANWLPSAAAAAEPTGTRPSTFLAVGVLPDAQRAPVSLALAAASPLNNPVGDLTISAGASVRTDPLASVTLGAGLNLKVDGSVVAPGGTVALALTSSMQPAQGPVVGTLALGAQARVDVSGTTVLQQPQTGLLPTGRVLPGGGVSFGVSAATLPTPIVLAPGSVVAADGAAGVLGVTTTTAQGTTVLSAQSVASAGGAVTVAAGGGGAVLAGLLHASGGDATVGGGTFTLQQPGTIVVQQAPVAGVAAVTGASSVSADVLSHDFASADLAATDQIRFVGDIALPMAANLTLDAPLLTASPQSRRITLGGASVLRAGASLQQTPTAATATGGNATLALNGGLVELFGQQVLQGVGSLVATAGRELRLQSLAAPGSQPQGDLAVQASVTLSAPQIVPTTQSRYIVDAPGQQVLLTGGDSAAPLPLSAGGAVTINAASIGSVDAAHPERYGVLRAPFGSLTLNATDRIDIGAGSLLSVSGAGTTVPYGQTNGGSAWTYAAQPVDAPPAKSIALNAAGQSITTAAGATFDLSGGGNLVATEFVPGVGGSKNVFAGAAGGAFAVVPGAGAYAPEDVDILGFQRDASGQNAPSRSGASIRFGDGGPIAAGIYAVLPAAYAVLPGAFLVTPLAASAAPLALGAAVAQTDGTVVVGGRYGVAGTGLAAASAQSFKVATATQAATFSEVDQTNANAYFAARASAAGVAAPPLPTDAGVLGITAGQLRLDAATRFALPTVVTGTGATATTTTVGRGGELDIAADRIRVAAGSALPGELALDPAALNATGASRIVLGGRADAASGQLAVSASSVVVDNAATPLALDDLVLAATGSVLLLPGASITAPTLSSATPAAAALGVVGDGALLRVSSDPAARSTRTGTQGTSGLLTIGAGARLSGGALTAEGTLGNRIATDATLAAQSISLGAARIAVGQAPAGSLAPSTLALTPALASQVAKAGALTLRGAAGIDLYGPVTLGSAAVHELTLDTGSLTVQGSGATATLAAGGVTLSNTSGTVAAVGPAGSNRLQIDALATDSAAGTGQLRVGPGAVATAGVAQVAIDAAHEVVLGDTGAFATAGDLAVRAAALQAAPKAGAALTVGGAFSLATSGSASAQVGAGPGAQVSIAAASIEQAGQIRLPSGVLTLAASGNGVHFAAGSLTDVSGRATPIDGVTVATPGGALSVNAAAGNVAVDAGAVLDVSGAFAGSPAGSLVVAAPAGSVALQGSLRGSAAAGQDSGSLKVDSLAPLDLAALALTLQAAPNNFAGGLDLRTRQGDEQLPAGTRLAAQQLSLAVDDGTLRIAGTLEASGGSAPRIALAGGNGLTIAATASIGAHSDRPAGGEVELTSGRLRAQSGGGYTSNHAGISLDGGVIDVTGSAGIPTAGTAASSGSNGSVLLRAPRSDAGVELAIGGTGSTAVRGASTVQLDAVKSYTAASVDTALIATVTADNRTLGGSNGANAAQVAGRVGALLGQPASALQLRSGVEIDASGDLAVAGNPTNGGWNLTAFAANGTAQAQPSDAPMDLTLRAAGNLNVTGSLSDGFLPAGTAPTTAAAAARILPASTVALVGGQPLAGANLTLVGGADLGAANPLVTATATATSGAGDVTIGAAGKNVLVRTTTGDIRIAAGRDVVLANPLADVYTTGAPVAATNLTGYVGNLLGNTAYLRSGSTNQSPFLAGGGNLEIAAGRDIVGDPTTATLRYATGWAWRQVDRPTSGQPVWWNRYDLFQQGFATFGGGDVMAVAGRDVVNAGFAAASSGYVPRDAAGTPGAAVRFDGGDLRLAAGGDVLGSVVMATGSRGDLRAGRNLAAGGSAYGLQVLYGNTAVSIGALDNAEIGLVSAFGLVPGTPQYLSPPFSAPYLLGLTPQASLRAQAAAGNLAYDSSGVFDTVQIGASTASKVPDRVVPDVASLTAPNGNLSAVKLIQAPAGTTGLSLLAGGDLTVGGITVNGSDSRSATPSVLGTAEAESLDPLSTYSPGLAPFDLGTRSALQLVAQTGDIRISEGVLATSPLRLVSGRDIVFAPLAGGAFRSVTAQHQNAGELSVLEAGRDILVQAPNGSALNFAGPGNLFVTAGRNIDLGTSDGVLALGNRRNPAVPGQSGAVTVAAGISLAGGDYTQAARWWFPVLGGTGVAGHPADLAAQLAAFQAGQPLAPLGSAAALDFAALTASAQVARVQTLVGGAVFDAAVLADAQRRAGSAAVTAAQAAAGFAALAAADQQTVLAAALANAWSASLPATQQQQAVLAMAAADKSPWLAGLQPFIAAMGLTAASPSDALTAFAALPPQRQALLTDQVLVGVLRQSGRAASVLSGSAQTAAYAPAYAALDLVFPHVLNKGGLALGASQIETLQNSDITVLAPRGSVDVGTLAVGDTQKPASQLGIVTANGGNLSVVAGDSVNVDQSRVFTVGLGDLLMWASNGSLDAGRGGKTVVGAPAPVYTLNAQGQFVIDTSGSFSGSGIAVLNAASSLDLYAPKGQINAGDAGIQSRGNAYFGAVQFVGADNLSVGGISVGAPPPASTGGATAGLAAVSQATAAATTRISTDDSEDEKARKRRRRLNLVLDFLGFGDGTEKP